MCSEILWSFLVNYSSWCSIDALLKYEKVLYVEQSSIKKLKMHLKNDAFKNVVNGKKRDFCIIFKQNAWYTETIQL